MALDPDLLSILACPVCRGTLTEKGESLACSGCRRVYPVLDGIPQLLPDSGRLPGG